MPRETLVSIRNDDNENNETTANAFYDRSPYYFSPRFTKYGGLHSQGKSENVQGIPIKVTLSEV